MCLSLKESLFVFTSKNVYKFIAQMSILNKKRKKIVRGVENDWRFIS